MGYPLWAAILAAGHHFLVRVGANVNLLTERTDCTLEGNQTVLSWPQDAVRTNLPPLRLRLVKVRVGKTWMWLLTSVAESRQLNLKTIRELYKKRWGIEVEFRGLKQTLDKRDLRCRNEARVKTELHWSLMGMAIAELFAQKEQLSKRRPPTNRLPDPTYRSLAGTMRTLRWSLHHLDDIAEVGESLTVKLQEAVTDTYERTAGKAARYRPDNPDKKPLGDPKLRTLKPQEKLKLKTMRNQILPV